MSGLRTPAFLGRRGTSLILAVVGIGLLLLISLPLAGPQRIESDPAADAQAVYDELLARVAVDATAGAEGAAKDASAIPAAGERSDRTETGADPAAAEASVDEPGTEKEPTVPGGTRPARDLFAPAPQVVPRTASSAPRAATPAPPPLPRLAGILIDGSSRRAVLSGRVVAVGEEVLGYRVVAIEPAFVRLARGATTYRLDWKEKS